MLINIISYFNISYKLAVVQCSLNEDYYLRLLYEGPAVSVNNNKKNLSRFNTNGP